MLQVCLLHFYSVEEDAILVQVCVPESNIVECNLILIAAAVEEMIIVSRCRPRSRRITFI